MIRCRYAAVAFALLIAGLVASCGGDEGVPLPPVASPVVTIGGTEEPAVVGGWSEAAPMLTPRSEIASALLDDAVFIIGGFGAAGGNSNAVEVYDPTADLWQPVAPLPVELDHAMAAVVEGRLFVIGG